MTSPDHGPRRAWRQLAAIATTTIAIAACGSTSSQDQTEPDGRRVAITAGCNSCHGVNFTGAAGPSWVGLAGSTVTLSDGATVTADRTYLTEAIRNPSAQRVAGYGLAMPANRLDDEQIGLIVDYIESLANGHRP